MEENIKLKAKIFDLIKQQAELQDEFNQIEKIKQEKLKELMEWEKSNK